MKKYAYFLITLFTIILIIGLLASCDGLFGPDSGNSGTLPSGNPDNAISVPSGTPSGTPPRHIR